jgi:spermidine synthase
MQKSVRSAVTSIPYIDPGKKLFFEALNPNFGYFYTVKKSLRKGKTKFQQIELIDTEEFGKVLLLDNITQLGDRKDFGYHEPMVHPAMCSHPNPRSVLVIGGGDGGILREVLKHPSVNRVEMAELDGEVIDFAKKYLSSVHKGAFDDKRVNLNIVDGRVFTGEHPGEFDVIIMDMTDPFGPSRMLYTRDFFRVVRKALRNDKGIFVMHSESPVSRPLAFSCINKTLKSVFDNVNLVYCYIQMYGILWSVSACSPSVDISLKKKTLIDGKLKKAGITELHIYNGKTHGAMQIPFPYVEEILVKGRGRIITDKRPDFPDDFIS